MDTGKATTYAEGRDLILTCLINAPREAVFKAWTDPEQIKKWFAPEPWSVPSAEMDVRVGGASCIVMRGPDGMEFPNRGVFLDIVPNERLVITDAFTGDWTPSEKPFMTIVLTFEESGSQTLYTARVRHWSIADREAHEAMGFHQGWSLCAGQLAQLVEK